MTTTKRRCDHRWEYDSTIWSGVSENTVIVGRYCVLCHKAECASAETWRPISDKYVSLRKHLKATAKAVIR
jgi:hypothetical protein